MMILKTPRKSFSDKKEYKTFKLGNGLKILLVKQDELKREQSIAAVAMCVASGCFQDPKEIQGLSHLLEHMIFMGSTKYPKENEFDQFVSSAGGFDNAYTECEHTLFHFDIIEKSLAGALDRFAQFFISPLMSLDSIQREMEAVESEFQSNSADDEVRVSQIYCTMIRDDHPASNFIWGNLKTLRDGIEQGKLYEKLHKFRKLNYAADRMFLCIQSSVDMDELKETIENFFSDIPISEIIPETSNSCNIFKPSFKEKIFFVQSTTSKCKLLMTFQLSPLPCELKFLEYLASMIQYEGDGTLTDLFMAEQLALRVKAKVGSQSFEGNSLFTFFSIDVNLTSKGFNNLNCVLESIFAFLLLLKTTPIEDHKKRYEEFKELRETLFKFRKEKSAIENVQELAVNMRYFKDSDVVVGREDCPEFNALSLRKMVEKINECKFNLLILSDKFRNYDKVEKWFGTEYAEVDFPKAYEKLWNERWLRNELFLPTPNKFICKNFAIFSKGAQKETSTNYPVKIVDTKCCECYYKLDSKFKLPHGLVNVLMMSTVTGSSSTNLNMTSIFSMCVKNFLSEKLYAATIAGYSYKLNSVDNGLILRVNGFNEKLHQIIELAVETIKNLASLVDKIVFETFKKELKKNLHNCLMDKNLLNDDCRLAVLKRHHRLFFDRHENVNSINFHDFKQFCATFVASINIKLHVQGNFLESRALYIAQLFITNLNIREQEAFNKNGDSIVRQIPIGSIVLKTKSLRYNDRNSIVKNYYQIGATTRRRECLAELIVSVITEPLFDALRNHEQLGYGVSCSLRKNCGLLGIIITIEYQENKNSSDFINDKIEKFLLSFYETLKLMSGDEFLSARKSICSLKKIEDTDLEQEGNRNWEEIRTGEYIFDRNELEACETETLEKADFIEIYFQTFLSNNFRRKLSVQVIGDDNLDNESSLENSTSIKIQRNEFINEMLELKKCLESFSIS